MSEPSYPPSPSLLFRASSSQLYSLRWALLLLLSVYYDKKRNALDFSNYTATILAMSKSNSIHSVYEVYDHQKTDLLQHLLKNDTRLTTAMIFVLTTDDLHTLTTALSQSGKHVDSIHGKKKLEAREATLKAHLEGNLDFLVVSEAIARGLDFDGVKNIINFDFPELYEDYLTQAKRCLNGCLYSFDNPKPTKQRLKLEAYIEGQIPIAVSEGFNYASHALKVSTRNKMRKTGPRSKPLQNKKPKLKKK